MIIRHVLPGLLCATVTISVSQPATAAYVNIFAMWGAFLGGDSPDGIEFSGGFDELADMHTFTGKTNETFTSTSSFSVTNTLSTPFSDDNFWIDVNYSAFNPGGDEIGLSIDNTKETASYSSIIYGGPYGVLDDHSCSLPNTPDGYDVFTTTTCGVGAPDTSDVPIYVTELDPGQTATFDFTMTISATFIPAPEPTALAVFLPALLGLGWTVRRR